jgi:transcriptional pleiotropic regulator of transition state genes
MKSTGIVRPVDKVNRVVIPKELCNHFDIVADRDSLEIYVDDDKIILKKYQPGCIFCNEVSDVINFEGKTVCRNCAEKLKQAFNPDFPPFNVTGE